MLAAWGPRPARSPWLASRRPVFSEFEPTSRRRVNKSFRRDAKNGGRDVRAPRSHCIVNENSV